MGAVYYFASPISSENMQQLYSFGANYMMRPEIITEDSSWLRNVADNLNTIVSPFAKIGSTIVSSIGQAFSGGHNANTSQSHLAGVTHAPLGLYTHSYGSNDVNNMPYHIRGQLLHNPHVYSSPRDTGNNSGISSNFSFNPNFGSKSKSDIRSPVSGPTGTNVSGKDVFFRI